MGPGGLHAAEHHVGLRVGLLAVQTGVAHAGAHGLKLDVHVVLLSEGVEDVGDLLVRVRGVNDQGAFGERRDRQDDRQRQNERQREQFTHRDNLHKNAFVSHARVFSGAGVSMMNKTGSLYLKFLEDQHFYGIFYPAFQEMFGF